MTEKWKDEEWAQNIWYRSKVTRRRIVGWGGGAIGAMVLVPAPWRAAISWRSGGTPARPRSTNGDGWRCHNTSASRAIRTQRAAA